MPKLQVAPGLRAGDPFGDGDLPDCAATDRPTYRPHWVSLDAKTGRLACLALGLSVASLTGQITQSCLVRVFGGDNDQDESGSVLCASDNRRVADHGRPGRECAGCEERRASCTPRRRISWEEEGSGLAFAHTLSAAGTVAFAHTLSAAGTVAFTRYALALRREGLRPQGVLTRLSVEELRQPGATASRWRIRFEKVVPVG